MRRPTIRAELLELLRSSSDGMLHAEDVVSWARQHPRSALHRKFEWDDKKAALEYRIWQARRLIQVTVVDAEKNAQLVNLSVDRTGGGGYRQVSEVLSSKKLSQIMLDDALDELDRVKLRYSRVRQLTGVWNIVARLRRRRKR